MRDIESGMKRRERIPPLMWLRGYSGLIATALSRPDFGKSVHSGPLVRLPTEIRRKDVFDKRFYRRPVF